MIRLILGALLVLAVVGCGHQGSTPTLKEDGPLKEYPPHGQLVRGPVGMRLTDGAEVLALGGSEPATIVSVRSIGGAEGLQFLGARIAGPNRQYGAVNQLNGFPPTRKALGPLQEADGAVIEPQDQTREDMGYELLLGYEVIDDAGLVNRMAVEVIYEVADQRYKWVSPAVLTYCPDGTESQECIDQAG